MTIAVIPWARRDPDPIPPSEPREVADTRSGCEQLEDAVSRIERLTEIFERRLPPH